MASLRLNPIVHLGSMDEIGTIQRRSTTTTVSMKKRMKQIGVVSASYLSLSNPRPLNRIAKNEDEKQKDKVMFSRNLDDLMNMSIVDIVKNLKQAPLLVHVYDDDDGGGDDYRGQEGSRSRPGSRSWIKTERALFENWPIMKHEWESGKTKSPDGLIFVEEIRDDDDEEEETGNQNLLQEEKSKSWGVMVKGKGIDQFGPACYLLKTSRVKAGRGMDLFCTHFCLVRVKNLRGSDLKQFKSCWL